MTFKVTIEYISDAQKRNVQVIGMDNVTIKYPMRIRHYM